MYPAAFFCSSAAVIFFTVFGSDLFCFFGAGFGADLVCFFGAGFDVMRLGFGAATFFGTFFTVVTVVTVVTVFFVTVDLAAAGFFVAPLAFGPCVSFVFGIWSCSK